MLLYTYQFTEQVSQDGPVVVGFNHGEQRRRRQLGHMVPAPRTPPHRAAPFCTRLRCRDRSAPAACSDLVHGRFGLLVPATAQNERRVPEEILVDPQQRGAGTCRPRSGPAALPVTRAGSGEQTTGLRRTDHRFTPRVLMPVFSSKIILVLFPIISSIYYPSIPPILLVNIPVVFF